MTELITAVAVSTALITWTVVAYMAWRDRVDITTLGLILVMLGFAIAFALSLYGVAAPGLIGFAFSGALMLGLWRRHNGVPR